MRCRHAYGSAVGDSVHAARRFDVAAIPYHRMPADDVLWYPAVLRGKLLKGIFGFTGTALTVHHLHEVPSLEEA